MTLAIYDDRHRDFDTATDITAWQTALLMNSTGNYKKKITPEMLLGKGTADDADPEGEKKPTSSRLDRDEKDKKVNDLLNKFK